MKVTVTKTCVVALTEQQISGILVEWFKAKYGCGDQYEVKWDLGDGYVYGVSVSGTTQEEIGE